MLAALLIGLLQAVPMAEPAERASADDCAIVVEVGKAQLNWSAATGPSYPFYPEYPGKEGEAYFEACPWKALGMADQ